MFKRVDDLNKKKKNTKSTLVLLKIHSNAFEIRNTGFAASQFRVFEDKGCKCVQVT